MEKLLELKDVSLTYQTPKDEITAIKNLSFYCNKGDFMSIIGPSGCGKTTVLSLIAGLISPTFGEISISGEKNSLKRENLGYMLQKDELFAWRNIERNIFLPLEIKGIKSKSAKENAISLLKNTGFTISEKITPTNCPAVCDKELRLYALSYRIRNSYYLTNLFQH